MHYQNVLLGSAIALSLVFGFAGCSDSEDDDDAFNGENISLSNTDTTKNANNTLLYRSFESTKTNHYSANALLTINNVATVANKENNATAAYGFLFGLEETTDAVNKADSTTYYESYDSTTKKFGDKAKFYSFGIAAVRWCVKDNCAEWYVSWCKNVPSTCFNYTKASGFDNAVYNKDGTKVTSYGVETQIVDGSESATKCSASSSWKKVSNISLNDAGALVSQIRVVALSGDDKGGYSVGIYASADATDALDSTTEVTASVTGFTDRVQKEIGRYITVYVGESTTGTIQYSDISGNPIPADYNEE